LPIKRGIKRMGDKKRMGSRAGLRKDICKGNLMIKHNVQILARGIQSVLDKYSTAEGCIPSKGDLKKKL